MHAIVESQLSEVAALCRRRGVKQLDLFGSATRDDFDVSCSDLDFLVDLGEHPPFSPLDAFFGLKDALELLFGRPVDLVETGAVRNPYVLASIERDRQAVYVA
jgi:predicted nucleotidyltransferase